MDLKLESTLEKVLGIVIGLIVVAYIFPIGLSTWVDQSNWVNSSGGSIFDSITGGAALEALFFIIMPLILGISIIGLFISKKMNS